MRKHDSHDRRPVTIHNEPHFCRSYRWKSAIQSPRPRNPRVENCENENSRLTQPHLGFFAYNSRVKFRSAIHSTLNSFSDEISRRCFIFILYPQFSKFIRALLRATLKMRHMEIRDTFSVLITFYCLTLHLKWL